MTTETPLNLSAVDPPVWHVMVSDTSYGPYTLGQMKSFISEGRISATTRVAKGDGGAFRPAAQVAELLSGFGEAVRTDFGEEPANFVIITRIQGSAENAIGHALNELGTYGQVMPGIYLLRSRARLSRIRDRLQSLTGTRDKVMIVDASNDRLAWFHLGPETDVHVHAVWDRDTGTD